MGKKGVAALAGAVGAVSVAIGWKASRRRSSTGSQETSSTAQPLVYEDIDAERFVDALSEAIRIQTVILDDGTYDAGAFEEQWEMLERRYPLAHATLDREVFNDHALLYTWQGSDPLLRPIVLMAHQDVVPVEAGTERDWVKPPFEGAVVDGRIYGRGALDCKGPLIAVFEAIEYLLERDAAPERTVYLVSGNDEEVGGNGAGLIASTLAKRGVEPWFVIDEGGAIADGVLPGLEVPVALVGIAEKGFMNIKLTAHGDGGHSSLPPRDTAIARLAKAISAIESRPVPARIDAITPMLSALSERLPGVLGTLASQPTAAASLLSRVFAKDARMDALQRSTTVPTIIEGGVKANVVPQTASVIINVRMIPGDTSRSVADHIGRIVGEDIDVEIMTGFLKEASQFSSVDSDAWGVVTGVIGEVFPDAITAPWVLTGATDSRFFESIAGDVYRFSPFVLDDDAMGGFHGTNEHVRADAAPSAVSFFVRLIAKAADTGD
ncbi:MAG: M20/M25/M40 family metallo-hydrolase [Actinomycetota bacterium]